MATTICLCGDVMTGRGLDQILPHPSDPALREAWVKDAREYVELAERASGAIPRRAGFDYPWGELPEVLRGVRPDAFVANLETSVTTSGDSWPGKGIHYRMHPENVPCLRAAFVDAWVLANNHVLDFGRAGCVETVERLHAAGLRTAGAGRDAREAYAPAVLELPGRRILVFAYGHGSSGVPASWAAEAGRPGVAWLPELDAAAAAAIGARVAAVRRPGDLAIVSLHWGSNWGYAIPEEQRRFARALIDAGADVVHGHSSHHARPLEVYRGRLVLYGCGDFLNDYEGIAGLEAYRGDLALLYVLGVAEDGALERLELVPLQIRRMRLRRASAEDAAWLASLLSSLGAETRQDDRRLVVRWPPEP